jgi:hypothetical protein
MIGARRWAWVAWLVLAVVVVGGVRRGAAQTAIIPGNAVVGGVYIDADGMVRQRVVDTDTDAAAKARAAALAKNGHSKDRLEADLVYVSLPRLLAKAQAAAEAGQPVPDDLRYFGGMTQIRYVFAFPGEHDLVLAGPAEAWDAANPLEPVGKTSGRPVLQLDDLIVALRTIDQPAGRAFFGCSIDTTPDALQKSDAVARKYGSLPHKELAAKLAEAMGPQKVNILNTADNTRLAFIMVAADYKLKRISMGLETVAGSGVPAAFDGARSTACRFWYAPAYEPLVVSEDGNSYALRGPRLKVLAGAQSFDPRGATDTATRFAAKFSEKVAVIAAAEAPVADLENIADLTLLAALIRTDKLEERTGVDLGWARASYPVAKVPVAKTAETAVAITGNAIASGGVAFSMGPVLAAEARQKDTQSPLAEARKRPEAADWKLMVSAAKK